MNENTPKTLILIRHAHRDTDQPSKDNGLSDRGFDQVKKMVKFGRNRLEGASPVFFTSAKKRCVETITPLAKELGFKVDIDNRLTEIGPNENSAQYSERIDEFLDFWKYECDEVTVICSHGDWIPMAVQKLTGAKIGIKKCGWIEIEYHGADSYLTWMMQKYY